MPSLMIRRSISAILPKVLSTSAVSVIAGRNSSSDGSFRLMSNAVTWPCFSSRNSLNCRAISVLPTSGRGEQMMKTGVMDIVSYIRRNRRPIQPGGPRCRNYFSPPRAPGLAGPDQVGELDAVEFALEIGQPVADIAAQHERIGRGLVMDALVGDEFE